MSTSCTAGRCTGPAVAAFQWTDLRRGGSRAEPVCAGHREALRPYVGRSDRFTVNVKLITLTMYASRLAREPTTVQVGPDELADAFAKLADFMRHR